MTETRIVASGDLEEHRITALVEAGAPIDTWGVGTELGTSRDSPVVNGVYKLVADRGADGWRGVWKRSPDKATHPGPKQVFRSYANGTMTGDVIAAEGEKPGGEPLLTAFMREGEIVREEALDEIRERTAAQLAALPAALRPPGGRGAALSGDVLENARAVRRLAAGAEEGLQHRRGLGGEQSRVDPRPVVQPRLAEHVEHASRRPRLRVGGAVHDARNPREHDGARAHHARLERHVQDRVRDSPPSQLLRRLTQRQHLGVRRRVAAPLALVAGRGEHLALADHHGADRHVAVLDGTLRLAQREAHEVLIATKEVIDAHAGGNLAPRLVLGA